MLTKEMNERLTQVSPGTPGGELLRRYWHPVAAVAELSDRSTLKVRLLAEDLVLYRDQSGTLGLLAELCPHRRCSLVYGAVETTGLRCAYHGWLYDHEGSCLEQPSESAHSVFKDRIKTPAYPVREMGGLFWAYMGPGEPPLLPKHDYFVQPNTLREIGITTLPVNWLQIMENSLDPIHSEWLHSWYTYYQRNGLTKTSDGKFPQARTKKIGFDVFEYGIVKRRYYEGGTEDDNDWAIGHPILFPNILKQGTSFQIRVPIDDETTRHYLYTTTFFPGVEAPHQDVVPIYDYPRLKDNGELSIETVLQQDMMAWVTQGPIADRTVEHLGASDRGVILYRKVIDEMISRVSEGEDPLGVFRDPNDDVQIDIEIDSISKPLTKTSVRSFGNLGATVSGDTGKRVPILIDPEVIEKQMRSGNGQEWSPVLEEKIKMRLAYVAQQNDAEKASLLPDQ
jgi:5,5'-dehydrodivanillate O-demethylase